MWNWLRHLAGFSQPRARDAEDVLARQVDDAERRAERLETRMSDEVMRQALEWRRLQAEKAARRSQGRGSQGGQADD